MSTSNLKKISLSTIKNIAYITMIIDHVGGTILPDILFAFGLKDNTISALCQIFRAIGRISMPLFVFMLVEGFIHTRNVGKYMLRLLILAVISEVPFDLACFQTPWYPEYQNVMFSLLIALCLLWTCEKIREKARTNRIRILLTGLAALFATASGTLCIADYGLTVVPLALCFYYFRNRKAIMVPVAVFILYIVELLSFMIDTVYPVCMPELWNMDYVLTVAEFLAPTVLALPIILCYNGKKGKQLPKMVYYLIYPVHLLLIYLAFVCFFA